MRLGRVWLLLCVVVSVGSFSHVFAGLPVFVDGDTVITDNPDQVIGAEIRNSDDPIRDGSYIIWENTDGIYNAEELTDTGTSREKTTNFIKGIVNYALWILGLIALIYMMYHGFLTLTAGADEEKYKKWREGVRYAAIALAGIGVAWFVVSGVFWLVYQFTKDV